MPCKTARGPLSSVNPDRITTLSEFVYRLSEDPGILRTYDAKEVRRIRNAVRLTQFGLGKLTGYGERFPRIGLKQKRAPLKHFGCPFFFVHFV